MIRVTDLVVRAGAFSLDRVSFQAGRGEYIILMGKTGSGKTTLLESICGLRRVDSGTIELGGRDVTRLRPAERGIGYVPQDGALFTTMSVYDHLAFALRIRRQPAGQIDARVKELAGLLGISYLLPRRPAGLSGGEAQRVALGRALSIEPAILCLDEPLNALDYETHDEICTLLKTVQRKKRITTLHVTHDRSEAQRLADRVLTIAGGQLSEPAAGKN